MVAAARLGERLGTTPSGTADSLAGLLAGFSLPVGTDDLPGGAACTSDAIADAMLSDKKRAGDSIRFVLLEGWGKPVVEPLPVSAIREALPAVLRG
jgi:3-dehydroquinate synthetase